ncbi:NAD(P)/FAD-dependent oxidoreductase [Pseudoroseicyclus tamaricis]|uniref:FAD-dependent oxidoreductase n=1 Tax=Pseudoroseicyclus tamaricis TaxID=2705421 RepID=A0A6B2JJ48_9RHOB|nr:FAD-dependent oxidoreductase [Pseudoroseicyclus tamaricis]NDV01441.1 FAD-dependent oxidoreductase [Pseudoroseicyclus tamaricis]
MSFDAAPTRPQRIAIIGAGISGLAAAWLLSPKHRVTLFEAAPRLGGHARTVIAGKWGDQPVDTGFIVFNYANYPHLTRLFHELDVPVAKSEMSFGATIDAGRVEYGLRNLSALAAQRANLLRPGFMRMVRDIFRFNAGAETAAREGQTIGELIRALGLGPWFERYYLMPICGAIWSTPEQQIRDFPARALLTFFRNHALLSATGQHQWWTVEGGSIEYVRRLEAHLRATGCTIRTGTPVAAVSRHGGGATLRAEGGLPERYDQVIFACHPDQALRLLSDASPEEASTLGAVRYQDNRAVLHADEGQMPRRRACWSSWVYQSDGARPGHDAPSIGVTYWMNRLQNIKESDPLFVTLNPARPVREELIYDEVTFRHPVFDTAAHDAQIRLRHLQGRSGTWFAGAWTRHGFHEDGFASAVRIAREMEPKLAVAHGA